VGAYILSKRKHVTHRLQLGVKPDAFNPTLAAGDLVRVRLDRIASTGADSVHDYLYEVDRIGKSITGEVQLDLTHFPVDANLASVVAQEVNAATGTGLLLPTGLSGITCDVNSSADTSVPAETFTAGTFPDYGSNLGGFNESGLGDPPVDNPEDGEDGQSTPSGAQPTLTSTGNINDPSAGDTLTAPVICDGGQVVFYRIDPSVAGGKVIVAQATSTYTLVINDVDKSVYTETRCPDPSSPTGYGEPISSSPSGIVVNRYYTPSNPLTIPASSGTLSVTKSGVYTQQTGCTSPFTKSTGTPTSAVTSNYSVTNVVQIWMGANANGFQIPCGVPVPTNYYWDGTIYYRRSDNSVIQIQQYGGNYGTDGGFGISASLITNGNLSFQFVTSGGPVYVGETAPPPVPIVP
jgi:hypothetical protein